MEFISRLIMPLVIDSLGADTLTHTHTHTHTYTHTHTHMHTHTHTQTHIHTHIDDPHRINFKKPSARWTTAGTPGLKRCSQVK